MGRCVQQDDTIFPLRNIWFAGGTHVLSSQCTIWEGALRKYNSIFCSWDMLLLHRVLLSIAVHAICALLVSAFSSWHVNMLTSMSECFCKCASCRIACVSMNGACQHHPKAMSNGVGSNVVADRWIKRARSACEDSILYIYIYVYIKYNCGLIFCVQESKAGMFNRADSAKMIV